MYVLPDFVYFINRQGETSHGESSGAGCSSAGRSGADGDGGGKCALRSGTRRESGKGYVANRCRGSVQRNAKLRLEIPVLHEETQFVGAVGAERNDAKDIFLFLVVCTRALVRRAEAISRCACLTERIDREKAQGERVIRIEK